MWARTATQPSRGFFVPRAEQPVLSGEYKAGWQLGALCPIDVTTYITPRWAAQLDEDQSGAKHT